MEECVTGPDVGEEGIAKTLTLGGSLHETCNIHNVEESGDFAGKEKIKFSFTSTMCVKDVDKLYSI